MSVKKEKSKKIKGNNKSNAKLLREEKLAQALRKNLKMRRADK
jgi:hypothetical protein